MSYPLNTLRIASEVASSNAEGGVGCMNNCTCATDTNGTTELSYVEQLLACDGATTLEYVNDLLGRIVQGIPKEHESAKASHVASLLNLSHSLYQGRDRFETLQIRAQILFILSCSYVPKEASPYIDDLLRNSQDPRSRAAAAYAAGNFGSRGHKFIPALIRIITGSQLDAPVALGLHSPLDHPDMTWTTDRLEAIRALGRIGTTTDECVAVLKVLAFDNITSTESALQEKITAREALQQLEMVPIAPPAVAIQTALDSPKHKGPEVLRQTHIFTDQNGEHISGARLMGIPNVIAFFYTSCRNPGRCSTTTSQVLLLRQFLEALQIGTDVNVSLITLEPEVDDPARLRAYGDLHSMVCDERFRLLNPDTQTLDEMSKAVDLSVSRCCNTVTNHEATLFLLDSQGILANRHSVGDPQLKMQAVAEELRKIVLENLEEK